ncbi:MAG: IscS subfamily cysteine desulfurase [Rhodospirillaceae bacterium]|nr:IscS subfamily cysteine desulfurase [Rhodospirillaceae bacterium]
MTSSSKIYLDYQSTTPVDLRVIEKMTPFLNSYFANPHSTEHEMGRYVSKSIEDARDKIAKLINSDSREIIFTSGATESNNLAIKGAARFYKAINKDEIITVDTEHKCVIESVNSLKNEGFNVKILSVQKNGLLNLDHLTNAISSKTILVSVMGLNNEIGVIQPLEKIGKICREKNVLFHSDCAQAGGKIEIDVKKFNIDLLSLSSHKMYGPKGIGCLFVRRKPRVRIDPLFSGGFQESGLRSGTLPSHLCVGFGEASNLALKYMKEENQRIKDLSTNFLKNLSKNNIKYKLNGSEKLRWPGNINIQIKNIIASDLIKCVNDVYFSLGSACSDNSIEPSYVLKALCLKKKEAESSLRISIGRMTTKEEILESSQRISSAVYSLYKKREN